MSFTQSVSFHCVGVHVDVVRAYRSVLKEKEALEVSLKALSQVRDCEISEDGEEGGEGRVRSRRYQRRREESNQNQRRIKMRGTRQ